MVTAEESKWEIKRLLRKQCKDNLIYVERCSVGLIILVFYQYKCKYYKHKYKILQYNE